MTNTAEVTTDLVIEKLNVQAGQRLLNVGCGNGEQAVRMARASNVEVVGIEVDAYQLHLAKERVQEEGLDDRITVQYAEVNDMPFDDESFDQSWSMHCLSDVPDWTEALRNIARVLRPGGRLVVIDSVEPSEIPARVRAAGLEFVELVEVTGAAGAVIVARKPA
jgi:27-O-demethylrifamycin SV methyltransferase